MGISYLRPDNARLPPHIDQTGKRCSNSAVATKAKRRARVPFVALEPRHTVEEQIDHLRKVQSEPRRAPQPLPERKHPELPSDFWKELDAAFAEKAKSVY